MAPVASRIVPIPTPPKDADASTTSLDINHTIRPSSVGETTPGIEEKDLEMARNDGTKIKPNKAM